MSILGLINKGIGLEGVLFTANLNINYLKPIPTPGVYLATATLLEVKGRKCYFEASIKNGEGTLLATAGSLWIDAAAKL